MIRAIDITVHDADTLRFVLDAEVVSVMASTATHGMATGGLADGVMGVMNFDTPIQITNPRSWDSLKFNKPTSNCGDQRKGRNPPFRWSPQFYH